MANAGANESGIKSNAVAANAPNTSAKPSRVRFIRPLVRITMLMPIHKAKRSNGAGSDFTNALKKISPQSAITAKLLDLGANLE